MAFDNNHNPNEASSRIADLEGQKNALQDYVDRLTTYNAKLSPDGTILVINSSAAEICGKSPSELVGNRVYEVPGWGTSEDDLLRLQEAIKDARTGKSSRFEVVHKPAAAGSKIVDFSLKPVTDDQGNVQYLIAEGTDITEQRRIEDALRRSEENYRELVQTSNSLILRWNCKGEITFFNDFAQSFFGYSEEEIIGKNVIGTIVPDTDTIGRDLVSLMDDVCQHPEIHETNINENMLKDGTRVWIAWTNKPILDENGNLKEVLSVGIDITARKKSEEAVRESTQMLKLILESIPAHVFWKDKNSIYRGCNRLFAANAGLKSPEDIVDKSDYDLPWTRNEAEAYRADDQDVISTGIPKLDYEETQYTADGRLTSVRTSKIPLRDVNGEIIGVLGTFEDITEQKLAENRLQESEEKYRSLVENINDWVWEVDTNGVYTYASPKIRDLLGYEPEEILGKTPFDLMMPEEAARVGPLFGAYASKCEAFTLLENTMVHKDGHLIVFETNGTPVYDESGKHCGYRGVDRDITERKRAEDELRQSQQRLALHVNETPLGVIEWDAEFRVVQWNPSAERIFGYTADEARNKTGADLIVPPQVWPYVSNLWADLLKAKGGVQSTNENITKDGRLIVCDWYNTVLTAEDGTVLGVASLVEDVTARVRIEEEKRAFYRETVMSVTQGKLDLVSRDDVKKYLESADICCEVKSVEDTTVVRRQVEEYLNAHGLGGDELALFVTGLGEAMTNALKHASGGSVFTGSDRQSEWVAVADSGPGIETLTLPSATLRRGFSTKISMGMGYSIMLEVSDIVLLASGRGGTTVVMQKYKSKPKPALSLDDLPDTWDQVPSI